MEYRPFGRTGVRVSALGLGCWMFGDRADEAESARIIDRALDLGVNFFDTANNYGGAPGRSESIVGGPAWPGRPGATGW
ncbi:aldo/keto reductase [Nonomuraea ferruginea]